MFKKVINRWGRVLIIVFLIRTFLLGISFIQNNFSLNNLFSLWVRWDGPHYIDIAKNGYQTTGEQSLFIVFYPLYPIFIKLFNFVIQDFNTSSILVSIVFSFLASIFLYELTLLDFNKRTALLSVWFLNIFPTTYFLQASYTESVFLTFSLATIYFLRKGEIIPASISGFLLTLSRINGLLLLPLLIMEFKKKRDFIALLITPLGFGLYLFINYLLFNDFFYFQKPLASNWFKTLEFPWIGIMNLENFVKNQEDKIFYGEFIALIFSIITTALVWIKIRKSYSIYMFINLILFTSTSFILSTPRYILILFPIYILLGNIKSRILLIFISLISITLLIYLTNIYIKGEWAF